MRLKINYLEKEKEKESKNKNKLLMDITMRQNKDKRRKLRAGMFLFPDNVPVSTVQIEVAEAANCSFKLLPLSTLLTWLNSIWLFLVS